LQPNKQQIDFEKVQTGSQKAVIRHVVKATVVTLEDGRHVVCSRLTKAPGQMTPQLGNSEAAGIVGLVIHKILSLCTVLVQSVEKKITYGVSFNGEASGLITAACKPDVSLVKDLTHRSEAEVMANVERILDVNYQGDFQASPTHWLNPSDSIHSILIPLIASGWKSRVSNALSHAQVVLALHSISTIVAPPNFRHVFRPKSGSGLAKSLSFDETARAWENLMGGSPVTALGGQEVAFSASGTIEGISEDGTVSLRLDLGIGLDDITEPEIKNRTVVLQFSSASLATIREANILGRKGVASLRLDVDYRLHILSFKIIRVRQVAAVRARKSKNPFLEGKNLDDKDAFMEICRSFSDRIKKTVSAQGMDPFVKIRKYLDDRNLSSVFDNGNMFSALQ